MTARLNELLKSQRKSPRERRRRRKKLGGRYTVGFSLRLCTLSASVMGFDSFVVGFGAGAEASHFPLACFYGIPKHEEVNLR